jgi:hypothetical protein
MMTILARGLQWLVGSNLIAPLSLLAALTMAHQWWLERDNRIEAQGVAVCQAEHQLALVKAQRDVAMREAAKAKENFKQQFELSEVMRNEREAIRAEFAAHKAAASDNPSCLSDSVLDLLRGPGENRPPR